MKRFPSDNARNTYNRDHEPIGEVAPREVFQVETQDCFGGRFRQPADYTPGNLAWVDDNLDIVTGPIKVLDSEPGMAVGVKIHDIEVTTVGSLTISRCTYPSPLDWWEEEYSCKSVPIFKDQVHLDPRFSIPVRPIVGCLATAPGDEVILSRGEGEFGGNLDCNLITTGATVYLPVNVPGSLLYFGDCKAIMADGEIVNAPEVGTVITAEAILAPRPRSMRWPRVVTDQVLATIVCAPTVDVACRQAFREMMGWLEEEYEIDRETAAILMGMVAHTAICQLSNRLHTGRCVFPLSTFRS